jgi:hypothetical protein
LERKGKMMAKPVSRDQSPEAPELNRDPISNVATPDDPQGEGQKLPKIFIEGVGYAAGNLSDAAKGAIASLQFADAKIMALQNELAICQTARFAYIKGLRSELESRVG